MALELGDVIYVYRSLRCHLTTIILKSNPARLSWPFAAGGCRAARTPMTLCIRQVYACSGMQIRTHNVTKRSVVVVWFARA